MRYRETTEMRSTETTEMRFTEDNTDEIHKDKSQRHKWAHTSIKSQNTRSTHSQIQKCKNLDCRKP